MNGKEKVGKSLVTLDHDGKLAIISINNPPVNALNSEVMHQLKKALDHLEHSKSTRAAIITGAGNKGFVAGADIREFPELDDTSGRRMVLDGHVIFNKIGELRFPVICAINGYALGAGCELALACDIRIADENAKFAFPEVSLGIIPGYGGTQRLARLIGTGKAKALIFSGEQLPAEEAYRIGLVDKLVPKGKSLESAKELVKKIIAKGPLAISKAKQAIDSGVQLNLKQGLELEAELFGQLCVSQDKNEGVMAFLEKREPNFTGK